MTTLTYDERQALDDSMMQIARIQIKIYLEMVGDGIPEDIAADLIKNQISVMFATSVKQNVLAP